MDRIFKQTLFMGICGALLGPFLDGYHSAFGVLAYTNPINVQLLGVRLIQSDWWVPPMFGLAGIILGLTYPYLDTSFGVDSAKRRPPMHKVLYCISLFALQYYLSGLVFSLGWPDAPLHALLAALAAANWLTFDRTPTGAVMSVVTGLAGPALEIALINVLPILTGPDGLYHYTHPDLLGIPLWIGWVYAAGAPAVGNLARWFWQSASRPDTGAVL